MKKIETYTSSIAFSDENSIDFVIETLTVKMQLRE